MTKPYEYPAPTMYKAEVLADDSGVWATNGLVFATPKEAAQYAVDLASRWTLVHDWRVRKATPAEVESGSLR